MTRRNPPPEADTTQTTSSTWLDLEAMAHAAECLKTLAHPHRLRMIEMLLASRYTVGELAQACEIQPHVASGHLRLMQRCGFLEPVRDGRSVYYQIAEPCLADILACIRKRFSQKESG